MTLGAATSFVGAARLLSVNAGRARPVPWGNVKRSAIDKRPVSGRVRVHRLGLDGDEQADTENHGGLDQALYAFAREELDWWAVQLGRDLADGCFGENLTTTGIDEDAAVIGERWRVGSAELEVSCPRIPCAVFAGFVGEQRWVRRFTEHGKTGAYLRVVDEGELAAGDPVQLSHRPEHGVTIAETFRALMGDRDLAPRLLEAPELPPEAHVYARKVLDKGVQGIR